MAFFFFFKAPNGTILNSNKCSPNFWALKARSSSAWLVDSFQEKKRTTKPRSVFV